MSPNIPGRDKLNPLEIRLLEALRRTAPAERETMVELAEVYPQHFPAAPVLRLVTNTRGGGK